MRYSASEKLEIIRTVETSHLPVRRPLGKIGIPKTTFYAWLDRYASGGLDALEDHRPAPHRVWNRIPDQASGKSATSAISRPRWRRPAGPNARSAASWARTGCAY
jgi:transposase-like protein